MPTFSFSKEKVGRSGLVGLSKTRPFDAVCRIHGTECYAPTRPRYARGAGDPVPPFPPHGTMHLVFSEDLHNLRLFLQADNDQPLPSIFATESHGPGQELEVWTRFGGEGLAFNTVYNMEIISEPPNLAEILDDTGDDGDVGNGRPGTMDAFLWPATQDYTGVPIGAGSVRALVNIDGRYYHEYSDPEATESVSAGFKTARLIIDQPLADALATTNEGTLFGRYVASDSDPDVNVTSIEIFLDDISQGFATMSNGEFTFTGSIAGLSEGYHYLKVVGDSPDGAAGWDEIPVRVDFLPPEPPAGIAAIPGWSAVGVVWEANPEHDFIQGYKVERATSPEGPYQTVSPLSLITDALFFIDWPLQGLTDGTTYYYRVIAVDEDGTEGLPTASVAVAPSQWLWTFPVNQGWQNDINVNMDVNINVNNKNELVLSDPVLDYGAYFSPIFTLRTGRRLENISWEAMESTGTAIDVYPGEPRTIEFRTSDFREGWDQREVLHLNTTTNQETNGLPWLLSNTIQDVFFYDASGEMVINPSDDFSSISIDTERWTNLVGMAIQEEGILQLQLTPTSNDVSEVKSNYRLEGDFDVQIDYELGEFPDSATHWVAAELGIDFYDGSDAWQENFSIGRAVEAGGCKYRVWQGSTDSEVHSISTIHRFGKFRVGKNGNSVTFYYFDAPVWIHLYSVTLASSEWRGEVFIRLARHEDEVIQDTVETKCDNYRLNRGTPVGYGGSPEQWISSAATRTSSWYLEYDRIGDDFSGSNINQWLWSITGVADSSIAVEQSSGVLKFNATSGTIAGDVKRVTSEGHYCIEGDFDIQVDLKNWYFSSTYNNSSGPQLVVLFPWGPEGNNYAFLRRTAQGKYKTGIAINGVWQSPPDLIVNDSPPGKLRLRLDGNILTAFYWNSDNDNWEKITEWDIGSMSSAQQTTSRAFPQLAWASKVNNSSGWAEFDNFVIAHGKVVFEGETPPPDEISHRSRQEFPPRSFIVATDQEVAIVDPEYREVWMRFERGNMLGSVPPSAVFAENGILYEGSSDGLGSASGTLVNINFLADQAFHINSSSGTELMSSIDYRNMISSDSTGSYPPIVSSGINDIDKITGGGSTWLAVGTDGGISLIKNNSQVFDGTQASPVERVLFDHTMDRVFWSAGTQIFLREDISAIASDFSPDASLDVGSHITSITVIEDRLFIGLDSGIKVVDATSMAVDTLLTNRIGSLLPLAFDRLLVSQINGRILMLAINDSDPSTDLIVVDGYSGGLFYRAGSEDMAVRVVEVASENEGYVVGSDSGAVIFGPLQVPWQETESGLALSSTGRYVQARVSFRGDGIQSPALRAIYNHMETDTESPNSPVVKEYPQLTNQPSVTISGAKDSGASVWINGAENIPADLQVNWTATLNLTPGTNTFSLTSRDINGNESVEYIIEITYDNVPPVLSVDYPFIDDINDGHQNDVVNIYSLLVTGSVSDQGCGSTECPVTVRISSVPVEVGGGGAFSGRQLLAYGENEVFVEAIDEAGNSATWAHSILRVPINFDPCGSSTGTVTVSDPMDWYPEHNDILV